MDVRRVIGAAHARRIVTDGIVWHFVLVMDSHLGLITASGEEVTPLDRIALLIKSLLGYEVILGDGKTIGAFFKVTNRIGCTLVELVVSAEGVRVMRFEHRALLSLSFLVKVAVSDGHEARV